MTIEKLDKILEIVKNAVLKIDTMNSDEVTIDITCKEETNEGNEINIYRTLPINLIEVINQGNCRFLNNGTFLETEKRDDNSGEVLDLEKIKFDSAMNAKEIIYYGATAYDNSMFCDIEIKREE